MCGNFVMRELSSRPAGRQNRAVADVVPENYADGVEGTGLFEQATLFGIRAINARHRTAGARGALEVNYPTAEPAACARHCDGAGDVACALFRHFPSPDPSYADPLGQRRTA
jgi:hypothetical protein